MACETGMFVSCGVKKFLPWVMVISTMKYLDCRVTVHSHFKSGLNEGYIYIQVRNSGK